MSDFPMAISQQIWDMKYRLKDQNGTFLEQTVQDTWHRIAKALSEVETEPKKWETIFYNALTDFKFCLLYTSPSPRDRSLSRMPSSA